MATYQVRLEDTGDYVGTIDAESFATLYREIKLRGADPTICEYVELVAGDALPLTGGSSNRMWTSPEVTALKWKPVPLPEGSEIAGRPTFKPD